MRMSEPTMHDTRPAACWTDGFRTANGECGAVLYGEPAMEKVVFEAGRSCHPAYEFRISSPGMAAVGGYGRITDSRTGEVTSTWTDGHGTWARRAFASRADQVIAHFHDGINIEMLSTSAIRISCVVREHDVERAVGALHSAFDLSV